jgi:hypothetical protein
MNIPETQSGGSLEPVGSEAELRIALEESIKLQSHYARLLNMHDGGKRSAFKDAAAWIGRLRVTGTLPNAPAQRPPAKDV